MDDSCPRARRLSIVYPPPLEPFQINIPCFSSSSRTSAAQRREIRVASAPRAAKRCSLGSSRRAESAGAALNERAALVAEIARSTAGNGTS